MRQTGGWKAARARRIGAVLEAVEGLKESLAHAPPRVTGPDPRMGRPTKAESLRIYAGLDPELRTRHRRSSVAD
jgi:hypothetical protein